MNPTKGKGFRLYKGDNKLFLTACELVKSDNPGFIPSYRQYRKWERGFGSAFSKKEEAQQLLSPNKV